MIGNTIKFRHYNHGNYSEAERSRTMEQRERTGIVVDAYTEISGSISGKSETVLSFGSGKVTGSTSSKRMYKVQYEFVHGHKSYIDIYDWQLIEILQFAGSVSQEINEEKIKQ